MVTTDIPTIFISYAREDSHVAEQLYTDLQKQRCEPWLDMRRILAGQNWKEEINKAIRESDFFIALLSHNSVSKRGFVQKEIKEAIDVLKTIPAGDIFFIPVRINECEPSYSLIQDLHRIDLFPNWLRGLQQIVESIRSRNSIPPFNATLASLNPDEGNLDTRYLNVRKLVVTSLASVVKVDPNEIDEDMDLRMDLGVDSIALIMVLSRIRDSFQLDLSTGDIFSITTVRSMILLILIALSHSNGSTELLVDMFT